MSTRTVTWLAWSLCALSLALTALSLLLLTLTLFHPDAPTNYYWLETTVIAASYSTLGAVVAPRLPDLDRPQRLSVIHREFICQVVS